MRRAKVLCHILRPGGQHENLTIGRRDAYREVLENRRIRAAMPG